MVSTNVEALRRSNDVAGFLFSAIGTIFAVVLGFLVVIVWEKFDAAVNNAQLEVAAVSDLICEFDSPFSGAVGVPLDGWSALHDRLAQIH